jgi:hypothetical protein
MVWPNALGGMVVCAWAMDATLSGRRLDSDTRFSFQGNPEAASFTGGDRRASRHFYFKLPNQNSGE